MNQGVFTLTEESFVSLQLKELEDKGVDILACKTCVDYYELGEKLTVGKISGMAQFIEHYPEITEFTIFAGPVSKAH